MAGSEAIEANREALKRIVAMLADMAGFAEESEPAAAPLWGGRRPSDRRAGETARSTPSPIGFADHLSPDRRGRGVGGCDDGRPSSPPLRGRGAERSEAVRGSCGALARRASGPPCASSTSQPPPDASRRPDHKREGEAPPKLPRLLWRAILAILRPAESAARRLIIAAARGIVVEPPPPRPRKPKPQAIEALYRRLGLAVPYRPGNAARSAPILPSSEGGAAQPRIPAFCLSDPRRYLGPPRPRTCPPHLAPRIMYPGLVEPHRLPPPPSAEDLIDATRLIGRISSLAAALDDLTGEARRFARLQARRKAIAARHPERPRRVYPIRHTRPPGGRLHGYDPDATHPKKIREVDEILAHAHALAMYALHHPDTS